MRLEVETFLGCASSRTGAHVCGWFNFLFNSIYIALQVHALAKIKNISDRVFQTSEFYWNEEELEDDCKKTMERLLDKKLPNEKCIGEVDRDALIHIENVIVPQFYWSTLIPCSVLVIAIFWLTNIESKNARLVRALCWTFVAAIGLQLLLEFAFLAYVHGELMGKLDCTSGPHIIDENSQNLCKSTQGLPWSLWFTFVIYAICNGYFIPVILYYTRQRVQYLNDREDDLVSHASGIFLDSNPVNFKNDHISEGYSDGDMSTDGAGSERSERLAEVKNRKSSFRIEDDPFGDNFRASLEDIRSGTRVTAPRTPNMSRYSSRNSHEAIKEQPDLEAISASSFSNETPKN